MTSGNHIHAINTNVSTINELMKKYYEPQLAHQLYGTGHQHQFYGTPVYADPNNYNQFTLTPPKEPPMTTLDKMRQERREQRERERIERVYAEYDALHLDEAADGLVLVFRWKPSETSKSYAYAALKADDRWYVTGRESPNGLDTEDFVAWLISKDVQADDLEGRAP
jgi:hypothetical protein